jgi:hypothetical protein
MVEEPMGLFKNVLNNYSNEVSLDEVANVQTATINLGLHLCIPILKTAGILLTHLLQEY